MSGDTVQAVGRLDQAPARSAPLKAATTPGRSRAAETSTETMRAWAIGLRRMAAWSIPGRRMLSVQLVCPVSRRASSRRSWGRPT
jgi:hypothetical protein